MFGERGAVEKGILEIFTVCTATLFYWEDKDMSGQIEK